jgi:hypothetical protein
LNGPMERWIKSTISGHALPDEKAAKVASKMTLHMLAYNMKLVTQDPGLSGLMAASDLCGEYPVMGHPAILGQPRTWKLFATCRQFMEECRLIPLGATP